MSATPRSARRKEGLWRVSNPLIAQQYRLNVGTIIESPMLNVRMVKRNARGALGRGGMSLGKVEEYFLEMLSPGDTFLFSGKVLRFEGIRENECLVSQGYTLDPKVPSYAGGKFPLSTYLAAAGAQDARRSRRGMRACPTRCATGCRCRTTSRCCRRRTNC